VRRAVRCPEHPRVAFVRARESSIRGSEQGRQLTDSDITPEARLRIEAATEEYEMELRRQLDLSQKKSHSLIEKRKRSFRDRMLENELADVGLTDDQIHEEEGKVVNINLWASLAVTAALLVVVMAAGDSVEAASAIISQFMAVNLSWFYVLIGGGSVMFLLYLAFSRFGNVVLGDPKGRPEFTTVSWYAMLLSTGIGAGLMFWGAAEPLQHYLRPPNVEPRTAEAAREAMIYACFHWGIHIWAIFTLTAVSVAYYGFRKRKRYLMSSTLMDVSSRPGARKVFKVATDLVSTLAVIAGICASLGMAVLQIGAGIEHVFGVHATGTFGLIAIMAAMTVAFVGSTITGLKKGIKTLALLNVGLALTVLLFVFAVGPTRFILKLFVDTLGQYVQHLPELSFKVDPFNSSYEQWMGHWTLFYFAWVIAWAPFVGVFVARISRGRTLRELIIGSLLLPTVMVVFWFAAFGGTALHLEHIQQANIGETILSDVPVGLFVLFEQLPLSRIASIVSILLLFLFLVTSADSATFVVSMMTSHGDLEPQLSRKIIWGVVISVLTVSLVLGGGLSALQAATLVFAFPFALVLILAAISMAFRLSIQVKTRRT
jgi:glycine betaine transporter